VRSDIDRWSARLDAVRAVRLEPSVARFGSFLEGVPGRVVVDVNGLPPAAFALAAPRKIRDWFAPALA
jgi:hypothetical protein